MPDTRQWPTRVATTDTLKEAYYRSAHWARMREARIRHDGYACVLCKTAENLVVHHFCYVLFGELLIDLATVCDGCHEKIHDNCRMSFPTGMSVEHAERLIGKVQFEPWLRPPGGCDLFGNPLET
jgi:predicted HNH restriction endonuclease